MLIVDARHLQGGIGTYTVNVVRALAAGYDCPWQVIVRDREQQRELEQRSNTAVTVFRYCSAPFYSVREQLLLSLIPRCHTLLCCHYNAPLWFRGRLVVTVHDLAHFEFYHGYYGRLKRWIAWFVLRQAVRRAAAVLTVSTFSRERLNARLGLPALEKCTVVGNTIQPFEKMEPFEVPQRYLLFVGNSKPHKNCGKLLEAFELYAATDGELELVVVLPEGSFRFRREQVDDSGDQDKVSRLQRAVLWEGKLPLQKLAYLYNRAGAVCVPSLYEGFGLPALEGAAFGVPVVCADIPPLVEIGGEAFVYFDPVDPADICRALQQAVSNPVSPVKLQEISGRYSGSEFRRRLLTVLQAENGNG